MTEIVDGEIRYNELTKNANGGTELMARRMVEHIPQEYLKGYQIIHSRVRKLEPDLKKILVCHDLHNDPEVQQLSDPEYRKQFEKIVFVSNWQANMFHLALGIPYSEFVVINNAVSPFGEVKKTFDGKVRLIYHTTPHRGLAILYPVMKFIANEFKDFHLDVFSSFAAYGWEERDEPYLDLFKSIEDHPNMTYHGFQPNDIVIEHLKKSHIFAYPNIWPETSCLALIEALCCGNIALHPNLAALPETGCGLSEIYQYNEDMNEHAKVFAENLLRNLVAFEKYFDNVQNYSRHAQNHASAVYSINRMVSKWMDVLGG